MNAILVVLCWFSLFAILALGAFYYYKFNDKT